MSDPGNFSKSFRDRERIPILVTRRLEPRQLELARRLGLEPICIPALDFSYPDEWQKIHPDLVRFNPDALAFTSRHGVDGFKRYSSAYPDSFQDKRVYAVGPSTAEALNNINLNAKQPKEHNALALARLIVDEMKTGRIAWFCGNRRRTEFEDHLAGAGFRILPVVVYQTLAHTEALDLRGIRAIAYYSPSAVEAFVEENTIPHIPVFAIGPSTTSALKGAGFTEIIESPDADTKSLLQCIADYYDIANEMTARHK